MERCIFLLAGNLRSEVVGADPKVRRVDGGRGVMAAGISVGVAVVLARVSKGVAGRVELGLGLGLTLVESVVASVGESTTIRAGNGNVGVVDAGGRLAEVVGEAVVLTGVAVVARVATVEEVGVGLSLAVDGGDGDGSKNNLQRICQKCRKGAKCI